MICKHGLSFNSCMIIFINCMGCTSNSPWSEPLKFFSFSCCFTRQSNLPNRQNERNQFQQSGSDCQSERGCHGSLHGNKGIQEAGDGQGEENGTRQQNIKQRAEDWTRKRLHRHVIHHLVETQSRRHWFDEIAVLWITRRGLCMTVLRSTWFFGRRVCATVLFDHH